MELIILFVLLGIVSSTLKKNRGASKPQPKPPQRSEMQYRQVISSGAEQQLAEAMKKAVRNAASRGAVWAQTMTEEYEPAADDGHVSIPGEGDHTPLAPSGEGAHSDRSKTHDETQPDICRSVQEDAPASVVRAPQAVKQRRTDYAARRLNVSPQGIQQGILWSEVLSRRGGRGRIH